MSRYAARHFDVDFEDKRLSFEEWGAAKAAGTYGAGNQLPVLIKKDGTILNESKAILDFVCHGKDHQPKTPMESYWLTAFRSMQADYAPKEGFMTAFFKQEATADEIAKTVSLNCEVVDKLDKMFSDGRSRVAGENITAGDFELLTGWTSVIANPKARNPSCNEQIKAHCETKTHYMRVLNNIKSDCQAQVDALEYAWI